MRFYTPKECEGWCQTMQVLLDDQLRPLRDTAQKHRLRCQFPGSFFKSLWFSRCIETSLQPRQDCLLWVTGFGIWPSSENYHLYYRLRQSYGDFRLLHEAPGHYCLAYEQTEVISFVQLSLLFGWDVHLIPTVGYGQAFISHDGWINLGFDSQHQFEKTCKALEHSKVKFTIL